jgi:hypothetical protein
MGEIGLPLQSSLLFSAVGFRLKTTQQKTRQNTLSWHQFPLMRNCRVSNDDDNNDDYDGINDNQDKDVVDYGDYDDNHDKDVGNFIHNLSFVISL